MGFSPGGQSRRARCFTAASPAGRLIGQVRIHRHGRHTIEGAKSKLLRRSPVGLGPLPVISVCHCLPPPL